jgi:hypothetical protein
MKRSTFQRARRCLVAGSLPRGSSPMKLPSLGSNVYHRTEPVETEPAAGLFTRDEGPRIVANIAKSARSCFESP